MRCISLDNPQCRLGLAAHGSLGGFCQYEGLFAECLTL